MQASRIAVVGTGANGGAIAADLTRAGLDVTLVEQWPAHVEAMRTRGLRVSTPAGDSVVTDVHAVHLCEVATMRRPFDVVLLGVKAYDTRWASELIRPLLAEDGIAAGLQNGMTIDDMADIFGPRRTAGCVIEVAANMFEPGLIERQTPPWFAVGAFDATTEGHELVAGILRHSGEVDPVDDIRSAKWMKLVVNASELVPSAILNLPLAEAVAVPGMREFMVQTGKEAVRTAIALGNTLVPIFGTNHLDASNPDRFAEDLLNHVLSDYTLPNTRTTVLQDWDKGRRAEVAELNGLIVDAQTSVGRSAPANARVVELARRIEAGDLQAGPHNATALLEVLDDV